MSPFPYSCPIVDFIFQLTRCPLNLFTHSTMADTVLGADVTNTAEKFPIIFEFIFLLQEAKNK